MCDQQDDPIAVADMDNAGDNTTAIAPTSSTSHTSVQHEVADISMGLSNISISVDDLTNALQSVLL